MLKAAAHHALGRRILKLELRRQIGAGSYLGRRWASAFKPGSHSVVSQLRPVAHQCAICLSIRCGTHLIHGILDDHRQAILIFIQRGNAF